MFGIKKKNIVEVEPPKSLLERLEYKIEKTKRDDYHTISVRYKDTPKKSDWKLITSFLKDELNIQLPTFGKTTIDNLEYDIIGVADTVEICQKRLNDFCKIIELHDNGMMATSKEYMDVGDLKENYIVHNL